MLFRKDNKVPAEIKAVNAESWYNGLSDQDRMRLSRYLAGADTSSALGLFMSVAEKALSDENGRFAVDMCNAAYSECDLTDYQRFKINEVLIDAYMDTERYEDAKAACEINLGLFPSIKEELIAEYGSVPEKLSFRNRYIDVIVGIDSSYDLAFEMLKKYNEMGILSDKDLAYRTESLKTHRLQRIFDGVYTYRPAGER